MNNKSKKDYFLNKDTVERKYETNDLFVVPYMDFCSYCQ